MIDRNILKAKFIDCFFKLYDELNPEMQEAVDIMFDIDVVGIKKCLRWTAAEMVNNAMEQGYDMRKSIDIVAGELKMSADEISDAIYNCPIDKLPQP